MTVLFSPSGASVIGIAGWKNSGKTTLAERLIAALVLRGFRVASVKHAHHAFQIDDGATDSARHRRAGASQTAIVSARRWALVTELAAQPEPTLSDVLAMLAPSEFVIVEGYKSAAIEKIEVRRAGASQTLPIDAGAGRIIAVAADRPFDHSESVPVFHLDDVAGLTDFLVARRAMPHHGK